ncbi:amino acid transporter [Fimbriimonas ginsengisoli Gsoil 348]|uniref:Amino acid transporter n=1 Tax=Fimbriimonas ginsengisoli Gsoil 348 TaxID=661478 RepID=A0A068NY69_FIMGI|nr:amino acid transporter [Fimbriimonas ginsengisoli Gsoil 348]
MLGLDALGSSAYGPEAALAVLIPLGAAASRYEPGIVLLITALLFIVYLSYRQTIAAYPSGGGLTPSPAKISDRGRGWLRRRR